SREHRRCRSGAGILSVKASWDIFCAVVDNFGDIGVTWRLARQLVAEHDQRVRLWVDDLETFVRLCPTTSASAAQQWHEQVEIRHWTKDWQRSEEHTSELQSRENLVCRLL